MTDVKHWFYLAVCWFQISQLLTRSTAESRLRIVFSSVLVLGWCCGRQCVVSAEIRQNRHFCCVWSGLPVVSCRYTSSLWTGHGLHRYLESLWNFWTNLSCNTPHVIFVIVTCSFFVNFDIFPTLPVSYKYFNQFAFYVIAGILLMTFGI